MRSPPSPTFSVPAPRVAGRARLVTGRLRRRSDTRARRVGTLVLERIASPDDRRPRRLHQHDRDPNRRAILEYKERAEGKLAEQTSEAAAARDEAQRSEAHYRAVVENTAEGILTVGPDGSIGSFNAAAEAMFGWTASEIVGQPVATIVTPELHSALDQFLERYGEIGGAAAQRREVETTGVRRNGSLFPMVVSTSAINVEGAPPTISGIIRDLSDQKRFEAQLSHQVLHDPLTGLPNRVMLMDRLEQALARVRRRERMSPSSSSTSTASRS